jgi:hypothetical protein
MKRILISAGILVAVFAVTLAFSATHVAAEVPQAINYQGRLTDASGDPIADGAQLIKFIIYDAPTGGTDLWTTPFEVVDVADGLFSVQLGASPWPILPDDMFANDTALFLGITVGANPEITPRVKLTSVAFAYQALRADTSAYALAIPNQPGITFLELGTPNFFMDIPAGINSVDSISITVPAAGYVYVWAQTTAKINHATGTRDEIYFQVSEARNSISYPDYGFVAITLPSELPTNDRYQIPVDIHRAFPVGAQGTYKFFANIKVHTGDATQDAYYNLQMTVMYFPTAYGPVDASSEAPGNDQTQQTGEGN